MSDFRGLVLLQPFLWMVTNAGKRVENRKQRWNLQGPVVFIAGRRKDPAYYANAVKWACDAGLIERASIVPSLDALLFGKVACLAHVSTILAPTSTPRTPWHMPNQFGYELESVEVFPNPVPWRGHQGLMKVPSSVVEEARGGAWDA